MKKCTTNEKRRKKLPAIECLKLTIPFVMYDLVNRSQKLMIAFYLLLMQGGV